MKSLFFICHLFLLYGIAACLIREYFLVPQAINWTDAHYYCRKRCADLATITTEQEFQNVVEIRPDLSWIGLIRTAPLAETWRWSDKYKTNFIRWSGTEPNGRTTGENCVVMDENGWRDTACAGSFYGICSRSVVLVKKTKTWEEARQHCRTYYNCLTFVNSEQQIQNYKTQYNMETQTASVWTGLSFLNGKWFWVNGTLLGRWVSLPQCPIQPYRCAAYNFISSVWENRDCNEELNFLCCY